jgi:GDP-L-fucose synthase
MVKLDSVIFVAGASGMVGSAFLRKLKGMGYANVLAPSRKELDLRDYSAVDSYFRHNRPDIVFLSAAKQGGIYANIHYKADFIRENISIQNNVIHLAFTYAVRRLLFFACSCIYPRGCAQPMKEEYVLTGPLEETNKAFAVAKICGLQMCESYNQQYGTDFITVIPTNLYGINQNYAFMNSLVVPALIKAFHDAKLRRQPFVKVWGTGNPIRDFLFADDLVDACISLMSQDLDFSIVNIASGKGMSIAQLAGQIKDIIGFKGDIVFDSGMPDGAPEKTSDIGRIASIGWQPKTSLEQGISLCYDDYLRQALPY